MRTVTEIIYAAGGPKKIAEAFAKTDSPILAKSVYDWQRVGIQDRYWPVLIKLAKATADELMHANRKVRARVKRPSSEAANWQAA